MKARLTVAALALLLAPSLHAESPSTLVAQCDSGIVVWNGHSIPKPLLSADESLFAINGRVFQRLSKQVQTGFSAEGFALRQRLCREGVSLSERQRALAEFYRRQERVHHVELVENDIRVYFRSHLNKGLRIPCGCPDAPGAPSMIPALENFLAHLQRGGMVIVGDGLPEIWVPRERVAVALALVARLKTEDIPHEELEAAGLSKLGLYADVIRHPRSLPEVRDE